MQNLAGHLTILMFCQVFCNHFQILDLEHAKRAVDIAIEQDEQATIDWLESVSSETDI